MATVFTPLNVGFSWTPSTTDAAGNPLPTGEAESGATIGIRQDGDATHAAGNYQYLIVASSTATSESIAAINAAIGKTLAPGNYWAAVDQTDILNGSSSTSAWTAEVPFSIPAVIVKPAAPTNFTVA